MHTKSIKTWVHAHSFGQENPRAGERRTLIVIGLTAVTMGIEIVAGLAFGSMALLADGLHMASHASALSISAFAYYYTRKNAHDARFSFGTGKVNSLAAFTSAVLLGVFALIMTWESVERFITPVAIVFNQAISVAVLGLAVNGVSLLILGGAGHAYGHDGDGHEEHGRQDHNLMSAYLHVLADALTSFLAIGALLAGKFYGLNWLDPAMGIVGAILVTRWSLGLIRSSSRVLLDMQAPDPVKDKVRARLEAQSDNRVTDLHLWSIGPGIFAAEIAVISSAPKPPEHYRKLLPKSLGLVHVTFEVRQCPKASP